jgi:hypothetical protein
LETRAPTSGAAVLLLVLAAMALVYVTRDEKTTVTPGMGGASISAVTRLQ